MNTMKIIKNIKLWTKKRKNLSLILVLIIALFIISLFKGLFAPGTETGEWNIDYMKYEKLHAIASGKGQKIALIDSGVSDFQKVDKNINFTESENKFDENGHGTMMYSLLKGYKYEVTGIAPDSQIISMKVMNDDESITPKIVEEAIDSAIKEKVDLISLSLGSTKTNKGIEDKINQAIENGIIVVSSSGDYSQSFLLFPSSLENVISVGAISANGRITDQSNAPELTTINAPGDDIKVIDNKKNIFYTSATSQATAIVTGYIALIKETGLQVNKEIALDDIKHALNQIKEYDSTYLKELEKIKGL